MNTWHVDTIKSEPGFIKPTVDIVKKDGRTFHLKDFGTCSGRQVMAKFMARREYRILNKLQGLQGIPGDVQLVNGVKLYREFIEGGHLKEQNPYDLPDSFFRKLKRIVEGMHSKGIAHLDLRHFKNVVVNHEGNPFIVDFETAFDLSSLSLCPALQNLLKWIDESALLRIKNRFFEHLMTEEDRQTLSSFYRWRRLWVFSPFYLREKDRVKTPE